MKVALVIGTRPEAIKMAPLYRELARRPDAEPILVSTGQHRELLTETLASLELEPAVTLDLMKPGQTLDQLAAAIHQRLPEVFERFAPDAVLVQGDTTTAMVAALTAFHAQIPLGHVEAGLRTGDLASPFPEEGNRVLIDAIARWCFAPTKAAGDNLAKAGTSLDRILVTGNTGVDSLLWMLEGTAPAPAATHDHVLLTLHRRESFGDPLLSILLGLGDFLLQQPDARVIWPVHPNPEVAAAIAAFEQRAAAASTRIERIAPPSYRDFCHLLGSCRFALSDSGGVQEEGPSLGKRVLIARDTTERPEAVATGQNTLVGRDRGAVAAALAEAWHEPPYEGVLPAPNPYGDGKASERIVATLAREFCRT